MSQKRVAEIVVETFSIQYRPIAYDDHAESIFFPPFPPFRRPGDALLRLIPVVHDRHHPQVGGRLARWVI